MRGILSKFISPEQFRFLLDRQIHDFVAIAQKCMHSIHTKDINARIMKVYLQKTYSRVNWGFM